MPPSAWAGTPRPCSSASRTSAWSGSTATPTRCASRGSGWPGSRTGSRSCTPVYDEIGLHAQGASGILFDLGVSSLQLDEAERGFAYSKDAPLDMRMDQTKGVTAADVIATYSEGNLRRIFERYGEEKLAGRYARFIIEARQKKPITRSGELVELLIAATPRRRSARRTPGEEGVPGAAHRSQCRAERARRCHPGGDGRPLRRRPHRGDVVPVARGPPGQAGVRRRRRIDGAGRASRRASGARPTVPHHHPRRRAGRRRGARPQSACDPGASACSREDQGERMSLNAVVRKPAAPVAPTRAPERRLQAVPQPASRRKPKLAYALVALGGALLIGAAQEELTGLNSPQMLASSAADLGMIVAGSPSYIRLSDGAVIGASQGAAGTSTVNPNGSGAVSNSLVAPEPVIVPPAADTGGDGVVDSATGAETGSELPPAITDGLPSPTTH
ncbi:hypothetical protein HA402_008535 [Bradysia odoriphaga]|nr:hypothetical protein HA402_008535 [Bradysia odoriphaga]